VPVLDSGVQDRPEQAVALRCGRSTDTPVEEVGMPPPHACGRQLAERGPAQGREDVVVEIARVELADARPQRLTS
jgi:hypothetical protein